jgi:hypothetical protein
MKIDGKRLKRTKYIHTNRYVIAVDVEMVVPTEDPSEPCLESETVEYLRELKSRAEAGEVEWLKTQGKVYEALDIN